MTTPTVRYVAEIDALGSPYTGPAMLGTERVNVLEERLDGEALVTRPMFSRFAKVTWEPVTLLRAVEV
jgi:hypothetical protein